MKITLIKTDRRSIPFKETTLLELHEVDPNISLHDLIMLINRKCSEVNKRWTPTSYLFNQKDLTVYDLDTTLFDLLEGEGDKKLYLSGSNGITDLSEPLLAEHQQALMCAQSNPIPKKNFFKPPLELKPYAAMREQEIHGSLRTQNFSPELRYIIAGYLANNDSAIEEFWQGVYERYIIVDLGLILKNIAPSYMCGDDILLTHLKPALDMFFSKFFQINSDADGLITLTLKEILTLQGFNQLDKLRSNYFVDYSSADSATRRGFLKRSGNLGLVSNYEIIIHLEKDNVIRSIYFSSLREPVQVNSLTRLWHLNLSKLFIKKQVLSNQEVLVVQHITDKMVTFEAPRLRNSEVFTCHSASRLAMDYFLSAKNVSKLQWDTSNTLDDLINCVLDKQDSPLKEESKRALLAMLGEEENWLKNIKTPDQLKTILLSHAQLHYQASTRVKLAPLKMTLSPEEEALVSAVLKVINQFKSRNKLESSAYQLAHKLELEITIDPSPSELIFFFLKKGQLRKAIPLAFFKAANYDLDSRVLRRMVAEEIIKLNTLPEHLKRLSKVLIEDESNYELKHLSHAIL